MSDTRPTNFLNDGSRSTQEAYYDFMLRKEKLGAMVGKKSDGTFVPPSWLTAEEAKSLDEIGEKEKLEIKILARLSALADSSPELLQVKALTDCKSREECARSLADIYYRKFTTEEVLNRFIGPDGSKKMLVASREKSTASYNAWGLNQ
jgi:hypothetical protein